jgi:hypothetical protein
MQANLQPLLTWLDRLSSAESQPFHHTGKLLAGQTSALLPQPPYSSRKTSNGRSPRMRKLATHPVPIARIAVPTSVIAVAYQST